VNSQVCVDASLALKLVLSEPDSDRAELQWQYWLKARVEILAPFLLIYETCSVLRNRVYRKELTPVEADEAFRIIAGLDITYVHPPAIRQSAWELAHRFNRPTVYDSFYLALAQHQGCPFWTGDKRLYNAVKDELGWVHWLGQAK
jgi:predicted nucleic acid-binding protein